MNESTKSSGIMNTREAMMENEIANLKDELYATRAELSRVMRDNEQLNIVIVKLVMKMTGVTV